MESAFEAGNSETVQFPPIGPEAEVEEGLERESRHVLAAVTQGIVGADSLAEAMDFLYEALAASFRCERLGLAFVEEEDSRPAAVCRWARADYEPVLVGEGYAEFLEGSSLEKVLSSGGTRLIPDLERYLEAHPQSLSTRLVLREGVRSSLTCPLLAEGRPVGFLFWSAREAGAFGDKEIRLSRLLAGRLSQVLEKHILIERLKAANRNYMEVLGFVSHEFKNPLASLVMDGETLLGGYLGDMEEAHANKVRRMVEKARYLLGLTREYLNLAQIESGRLRIHASPGVDLIGDVLEPAIDIVSAQFEKRGMVLERDYPAEHPRLCCDAEMLEIVAVNLLGNAAKYGNEGGKVRLGVSLVDRRRVRVAVWNEGPGFPRSAQSRLFQKFSRISTPELSGRRGTGVGLYTSWCIVEAHGGRIWAESEQGGWAEFVYEVPLRAGSSEDCGEPD